MSDQTEGNNQGGAVAKPEGAGTPSAMMQFREDLSRIEPQFARVLPANVPVEKFKTIVLSAINQNPDLVYADRRSFWSSALKCATDGLLPDGREAVLLSFNSKVKRRDPKTGLDREVRVDLVTYIPMIAGIRKRLRNSGEVASAHAEVVYRGDKFRYTLGITPSIEHEPPPLDQKRGDAVGAYAVISLINGEVLIEVMSFEDIERVRNFSRAKDGPAWKGWWGEMARKTVLRRASKSAPMSADLHKLFARDDEPDDQVFPVALPQQQTSAPALEDSSETTLRSDDRPLYEVTSCDGEVIGFRTIVLAEEGIVSVAEEAGRRGMDVLRGMLESNQDVIKQIHETDQAAANRIAAAFNQERSKLEGVKKTAPVADTQNPQGQRQEAAVPAGQSQQQVEQHQDSPVQQQTEAHADRGETAGNAAQGSSWFDQDVGKLSLPVPKRGNKLDYRAWMVAMFTPRLRQAMTPDHIVCLLSDNEEHLAAWRGQASEQQIREFDDIMVIEKRRVEQVAARANK